MRPWSVADPADAAADLAQAFLRLVGKEAEFIAPDGLQVVHCKAGPHMSIFSQLALSAVRP